MESFNIDNSTMSVENYIYQALEILLETKPYNKISITDICNKAGVSRVTFYRYYKDKDEILLTRVSKRYQDLLLWFWESDIASTREYWVEYFRQLRQDKLILMLHQADLLHQTSQYHQEHMTQMLRYTMGWELDDHWQQMHLRFSVAGVEELLRYSLEKGASLSNEVLAEFMSRRTGFITQIGSRRENQTDETE